MIDNLQQLSEFLTIAVSAVGMAVCLFHALFFWGQTAALAKRMKKVFLTDAVVYLVTLIMGVGLFFELKLLVKYDVIVRPFVLMANVYASWRLYNHYRKIK